MDVYPIYAYQKPEILVFVSNIIIKINLMKSLPRILLAFTLPVLAFSSLSFAKNKKVVFLADKGKNTAVHAHESGNAILAIAGEPTNLKVVSAHKGNLWIRLSTQGNAAHGSTPQYGNNAINGMSPILDTLTNEYPKLLSDRKHPLLGSPTISVGTIRGGSQPNVVPDSCEIDIDRRTIPGETDESVKKEMKNLFKKLKIKSPEFSATRSVPCPPLDTDPTLPLVQSFLKASNRRKTIGVPYFTDASPISMGGTPALVYGPGNIAQAHSKNEWVNLKEVELAEKTIFRFLYTLD